MSKPKPLPVITPGERYTDGIGPVVVMTIVDGYVMARRPKCIPFVYPARQFAQAYKRESEKPE